MTKITTPPRCGLELIQEFEGCHLAAYPDPKTKNLPITIGWGSTRKLDGSPFKLGDTITQAEADKLLIAECMKILQKLMEIPHYDEMNENQVGALLSFAYNLGMYFYNSGGFNTITRVLKNKEWDKVPDAFLLYVNPGTSVTAGLTRRRIAEGELWYTKTEPDTLMCIHKTFLKKTIQSADSLSEDRKVKVPEGHSYRIQAIHRDRANHSLVELSYGLGAWYIYNPHWKLNNKPL